VRRAFSVSVLLCLVFSLFGGSTVLAADPSRSSRPLPAGIDDLKLDRPIVGASTARPTTLDASLLSATGIRQVVVRLAAPSVVQVAVDGATAAAQRGARANVVAQQNRFVASTEGRVLARTEIAANAVVLEVDAAELTALAADPNVISIRPVIDYTLSLDETVPYIGATELHDEEGVTGDGVTVAVLDSGIDYTHAAFGDYAVEETYDEAYGADTTDQANKVEPDWSEIADHTNIVGGFDYVGEAGPDDSDSGGPLRPDPDPIDCGGKTIGAGPALCEGGHGTHVADIIGGIDGVAPGVEIYGVKVCSAVSTACSGVALLLGMDFALDPNGDGSTDDHVDIINMSLGSDYGQWIDDDLSFAVENASEIGVLTVAASGNGSDKPYVTGTPAAAPSAISVAQTNVPSASLQLITVDPPGTGSFAGVFQPWSAELSAAIEEAPIQYGDGAGGNLDGCDEGADPNNGTRPFPAGSLAGMVVLVDRGNCDFSLKIANVAFGGAEAGIIGMVNPDPPFTGSLGACPSDLCTTIPGYMVSQASSAALKAVAAADGTVTIDPSNQLSIVGTVVGSSSRGPTMQTNAVKPEIAAPGASVSAEAGTGTETTPFGGTSGATPMVSGSAALLISEFPDRSPAEIKSLLMNYAETDIENGAPDAPLAPIARIGGGEVRVNDSFYGADLAAWDSESLSGALSFGFVDATEDVVLTREVTVHNYSGGPETLSIDPAFRFADDEATGAVAVSAPASVNVPAGGDATFDVTLTIDASDLRDWTLDSGFNGNNPVPLTLLEYDGYIDVGPLHLAWHVLPRLSGDASASDDTVTIDSEFEGFPAGSVELDNDGAGTAAIDGYSLIGTSPQLPTADPGQQLPTIDLRYAGVQTIPVPAGECSGNDSFVLLLASNTWERQTHAIAPSAFEWDLDTDGDGEADFAVYNQDLSGGALTDGRNATWVVDLVTEEATIFFFSDHGTNSGNTTLLLCGEQIGMDASDFGTPITADLFAVDTYFTGRSTDMITGMEFAPLGERYFPVIGDDGFGSGDVPAGGSATLNVQDFGAAGTNPSETGVLLFTDGARADYKAGAPQESEAIALPVLQGPPDPPDPVVVPFTDISDSKFVEDIIWAWENGITVGCTSTLFCPDGLVTRGQMATFLARALDLPATSADFFTDDETNRHEQNINRVAEAGISFGCGGTNFCPNGLVTRAQMASFLSRGFDLAATSTDYFTDDEGSRHEANINKIRAAGITFGCGPTTFCPNGIVTRGQMAAFLHRASTP
jgi:minor extracellular serine protease Vpr